MKKFFDFASNICCMKSSNDSEEEEYIENNCYNEYDINLRGDMVIENIDRKKDKECKEDNKTDINANINQMTLVKNNKYCNNTVKKNVKMKNTDNTSDSDTISERFVRKTSCCGLLRKNSRNNDIDKKLIKIISNSNATNKFTNMNEAIETNTTGTVSRNKVKNYNKIAQNNINISNTKANNKACLESDTADIEEWFYRFNNNDCSDINNDFYSWLIKYEANRNIIEKYNDFNNNTTNCGNNSMNYILYNNSKINLTIKNRNKRNSFKLTINKDQENKQNNNAQSIAQTIRTNNILNTKVKVSNKINNSKTINTGFEINLENPKISNKRDLICKYNKYNNDICSNINNSIRHRLKKRNSCEVINKNDIHNNNLLDISEIAIKNKSKYKRNSKFSYKSKDTISLLNNPDNNSIKEISNKLEFSFDSRLLSESFDTEIETSNVTQDKLQFIKYTMNQRKKFLNDNNY